MTATRSTSLTTSSAAKRVKNLTSVSPRIIHISRPAESASVEGTSNSKIVPLRKDSQNAKPQPNAQQIQRKRSVPTNAKRPSQNRVKAQFRRTFRDLGSFFSVPVLAVTIFGVGIAIGIGNRFESSSVHGRLRAASNEINDGVLTFEENEGEGGSFTKQLSNALGQITSKFKPESVPMRSASYEPEVVPSVTADIEDLKSKVKFIAGLIAVHRPSIKNCGEVAKAIVEVSAREGVDPFFIAAVISVESRFADSAISKVGARGMMQLMPSTASYLTKGRKSLTSDKLHDTSTNISLGVQYLEQLEAKYRGNRFLALAAYNWGPGNLDRVAKGQGNIPSSVRKYARTIIDRSKNWSEHFRKAKVSASDLDDLI